VRRTGYPFNEHIVLKGLWNPFKRATKGKRTMSSQNTVQPMSASQIVAEARQTIPEITVAQAKEELDQGHLGLLLDVREPAEFEKSHIPGAVLAPRGMLEWYADPTTPYAKPALTTKRDAHIIVACASGGRSMLASETLKKMGYTNVVNMAGGFNEWSKQGFPIE
jgi:rhodanese-related sulfurtransferase